ncbi:hypothetical protein DKM19_04075 [Streptosporangium sp. 'caverna']|nr:hypothetical protein DKM19_04075 [Streptosporangium sp. 'caverna']
MSRWSYGLRPGPSG